ncbi:hypothetical protein CTAYLR_003084 [Chrysophaeum taylorii]|uniref:Glycosyltransferase 2-like domain-containing protein n=1 Tax=Chrysophaeum taylorii TaxID=2483200 RepID=A0AAD7U5H4_9STRA|nr:hypothetical protein CTAYLR_003084 [Chrysophaeum taylorii]
MLMATLVIAVAAQSEGRRRATWTPWRSLMKEHKQNNSKNKKAAAAVKVVGPHFDHYDMIDLWEMRVAGDPYAPPRNGLNKFVIVSWPRSTTNELVNTLNANPNIECQWEAMNPVRVGVHDWALVSTKERDANRSAFMRKLLEEKNPYKPGQQAAGFKVFYSQLTREEFDALVGPSYVKKIVVERQDLLATYVSQEFGFMTKAWTRRQTDNLSSSTAVKLRVDLDVFAEYRRLHDAWFAYAKHAAKKDPSSWLFVRSEDLTATPEAMRRIYAHIGVPTGPVLDFNPYQSRPLRERIANYREVAAVLGWPRAETDERRPRPVMTAGVVGPSMTLLLEPLWAPRVQGNKSPYVPAAAASASLFRLTPFVIISWPRSATRSLVRALQSSEHVECQGEAFSSHDVYASAWARTSIQDRDANRGAFMRSILERKNPAKPNQLAAGFALFPNQLTRREYDILVRPPHVKKIVVERRDVLATYVSHLLGLQAAPPSPGDRSVEQQIKHLKLHLDLDHYFLYKKIHSAWFDYARKASKKERRPPSSSSSSWLFLRSEALTNGPIAARRIYRHLGVPVGDIPRYYSPLSSAPMSQRISNYDDVAITLGLPARYSKAGIQDGADAMPPRRFDFYFYIRALFALLQRLWFAAVRRSRRDSSTKTEDGLARREQHNFFPFFLLLCAAVTLLPACVFATHRLVNLLRLLVFQSRSAPRRSPSGTTTTTTTTIIRTSREPPVTVQICCYNEATVIAKTIDAACSVDWPRSCLKVEILDDSTDAITSDVVDERCGAWRDRGFDVARRIRPMNPGATYVKSESLRFHHRTLQTDFVAVFDADHRPHHQFLRRAIPLFFFSDSRVAAVQCPWGFANRTENVLAQSCSLHLDAYFVVEQRARSLAFQFLSFDGTGGVWRRDAIDACGGWGTKTITEDLDLSYRAFIAGYVLRYVPNLVQDLELPSTISAYKAQQHRSTKGRAQVALKSLGFLWRSSLSFTAKVEALLHLTKPLACFSNIWLVLWAPLVFYYDEWSTPLILAALYPVAAYCLIALVAVLLKPPSPHLPEDARLANRLRRLHYILPSLCLALGQSAQDAFSFAEGLASLNSTFIRAKSERALVTKEELFDAGRRPKTKHRGSFSSCVVTKADRRRQRRSDTVVCRRRCQPRPFIAKTTTAIEFAMSAYVLLWGYYILLHSPHFRTARSTLACVAFTIITAASFAWFAVGTLVGEMYGDRRNTPGPPFGSPRASAPP